ncbi:hypothetical protein MGAST_19700 [Mycobacterium gastri 'Wayne']|nr:hypothetical protein MGAST_19700 [Mycobacterium gastri 'Wayne']
MAAGGGLSGHPIAERALVANFLSTFRTGCTLDEPFARQSPRVEYEFSGDRS